MLLLLPDGLPDTERLRSLIAYPVRLLICTHASVGLVAAVCDALTPHMRERPKTKAPLQDIEVRCVNECRQGAY